MLRVLSTADNTTDCRRSTMTKGSGTTIAGGVLRVRLFVVQSGFGCGAHKSAPISSAQASRLSAARRSDARVDYWDADAERRDRLAHLPAHAFAACARRGWVGARRAAGGALDVGRRGGRPL